mgnify:CR=1 FL=1|tara:strand:+ start:603 stop:932 length:330 start_codon:yes stop_codon:yes gene_type:complete
MLATLLSISIFCLGLREITDQGRILYPLREWVIEKSNLPMIIAKPILLCCPCLASFWGTLIFWSLFLHSGSNLELWTFAQWIFACISCSFISGFFWAIRELVVKKIDEV